MSENPTSVPARTQARHGAEGPIAYQCVANDELDQAAASLVRAGIVQAWAVTNTSAPSIRIDGPCARCGDSYDKTRIENLASSAVRGTYSAPEPSTRAEISADFLCDCDVTHPGAPEGERGCGANYTIVLAV